MARSLNRRTFVRQMGECALGAGFALTLTPGWGRMSFASPTGAAGRGDVTPEEAARLSALSDKVASWSATTTTIIRRPHAAERRRVGQVRTRLRKNGIDALRLYRFTAPADLDGTSLLIRENAEADDDIWLYLPAAGKTRRILSSSKKDAFLGTEFAYVDLMTQRVGRFSHHFEGTDAVDGHPVLVLVSEPREEGYAQDIGYSKQVSRIDLRTWAARRIDYFDLRGRLIKTQTIGDFQEAGDGKVIARSRRMVRHGSGRETLILLNDLEIDVRIPARVFSPQRLGRR